MLLRAYFLHWPISHYHQDFHGSCPWLAHLLPLRDLLPGLACLVQLDCLRAHNKLPRHVCAVQCNGYSTRHQYPLPARSLHQEAPNKPKEESGCCCYLRPRCIVASHVFGLFSIFADLGGSCVVASMARLIYTVEFMMEDPENDFASNFNSTFPSAPLSFVLR